jgi:hypothetical protein
MVRVVISTAHQQVVVTGQTKEWLEKKTSLIRDDKTKEEENL